MGNQPHRKPTLRREAHSRTKFLILYQLIMIYGTILDDMVSGSGGFAKTRWHSGNVVCKEELWRKF